MTPRISFSLRFVRILVGGWRTVNRLCLENGLYLVSDSISCFVRIQPPVNIPASLFEQGLDILEDAIRVASGGAR